MPIEGSVYLKLRGGGAKIKANQAQNQNLSNPSDLCLYDRGRQNIVLRIFNQNYRF